MSRPLSFQKHCLLFFDDHIVLSFASVSENQAISLYFESFSHEYQKSEALAKLYFAASVPHTEPALALLHEHDYELRLVEKPPVVASEMAEAIKWEIFSTVDVSAENQKKVISAFASPDSKQLFAVITDLTAVQDIKNTVEDAGCILDQIIIPELAMATWLKQIYPRQIILYFKPHLTGMKQLVFYDGVLFESSFLYLLDEAAFNLSIHQTQNRWRELSDDLSNFLILIDSELPDADTVLSFLAKEFSVEKLLPPEVNIFGVDSLPSQTILAAYAGAIYGEKE